MCYFDRINLIVVFIDALIDSPKGPFPQKRDDGEFLLELFLSFDI